MMNEEQKSDAIDLARLTGNIAAQTGLGWAVPGVSVTATGTHFARLTLLPSFLPLSLTTLPWYILLYHAVLAE